LVVAGSVCQSEENMQSISECIKAANSQNAEMKLVEA
jgi:hypothetical protein